MDWDDLKILLALSRKRSARGAAQLLGVSNSTVTRRLDDFERDLGSRLFDRTPEGYRMTQAAENLLPTAEHVEELMLSAERQVTGTDQELEGTIRLTLPPASGFNVLMPRLAQFAADYPGIDLEVISSPDALDLGRREADIAIRIFLTGSSPPENLIGRKISGMTASAYVHRDLLNPDDPEDVSHLTWIGLHGNNYDDSWKKVCKNGHLPVRHAVSAITLQVEAVRSKMGMMFAACAMFRDHPEVVRVPGEDVHHYLDLWVLTHKDLRLSARMRILREILAEELSQLRPYFDSCCDEEEGVAKMQQA
ncbi:LysR family transcriptional regulator [Congregibacter brevis]|uniref:LysR family transcriptional regulator n=1 Tax=Congregibacter brevis TaxID=3081201 RepID=A0ABZ0IIG5_9GAMM|nr:LysR family transcriptional regulator [Congregibacter sp. IMCC45268]